MNVLVLGAGGFLGRQVARHLAAQPGFAVTAAPHSAQLDLARADDRTWQALLAQTRPDAVVNCAGRTSGDAADLWQANVTLVQALIRAARVQAAPPHLIHLGSAAEYGPQAGAVSEDTPARPDSPYGRSKLAGTLALLEAAPGLPVTVLRPGNPVGEGQGAQTLTGRAARLFREAVERGRPEVTFGDLSPARDFIDARDVARAVDTVLHAPPRDPLLNVGRGEAVSARTLVAELARISRYSGHIREQAAGSSRSAGVAWQQLDIARLRRAAWTPHYSLQDALHALWRDVSTQPTRHPVSL